jgi:hypothetical protein
MGTGPSKTLSETWGECDTDPPPILPGPGQYDPDLPIEHGIPRSRYIPKELIVPHPPLVPEPELLPEPGTYNPIIDSQTKIAQEIGLKDPHGEAWVTHSPCKGPLFNLRPEWKARGGYIQRQGHSSRMEVRALKASDHELAFSTLHSSLVKRTPNSKYARQQAAAAASD